LRVDTVKKSSITFSATLINGLLGMAFYILLARDLGPFEFGLFSLSITVLALLADIGNFGINTGIVNFVSKYIESDFKKSLKYLKLALYSKISIAVVIIIIGYFASPYISESIFQKPELIVPLKLVFLGVGTTWLFSFTTSYYQASQKFISWGVIQIFSNLMRLLLIIYFISISNLNVNIAIICYIVAPFFGFLFSFVNITTQFFKEKVGKDIFKEFFNFNKWIAVSSGIGAFSSRTDTFVLGRLADPSGIGIYSAANQLVQVVPQLIGAIGTVVAPKFSAFKNDTEMIGYFKKLMLMVLGIALVMVLFTPAVRLIINLFFGEKYKNSFGVFVILLLGALVFFISIPVHNAIIYYYSYPKLFSYLSILNLIVVFSAAIFFTSNFGYRATAYAVLMGNSLNFIIPAMWLYKRNKGNAKSVKS